MIIPLPPGSALDVSTRVLVSRLAVELGQTIVVENKAGGNGIIGMQDLLRAPPDGSTVLMATSSHLSINMALAKNLPYDPRRDITPIAGFNLSNHALIVKNSFPARTLQEFLAVARQRSLSVGYSTSLVQMQIAALNKMAGLQLLPVPYKGTPPTITDLIGGTLDATMLSTGDAVAQLKGGQLRALAVTSLKRNPLVPDWPAISETLPGYDFGAWVALIGPVGMSADIVKRLSAAMNAALRHKETADQLIQTGFVPWIMSPEELKTYIEADVPRWIQRAAEAGIKPE
jgi:tripartite-type tricarboxylate transporter receptor subunit TctC